MQELIDILKTKDMNKIVGLVPKLFYVITYWESNIVKLQGEASKCPFLDELADFDEKGFSTTKLMIDGITYEITFER